MPLLEKQADSLTQLGQLEQALQARRYALRLVERKHGQRSLRFAQELESLGRWYSVVAAYEASRTTLLKALNTVEKLEGARLDQPGRPIDGARRQCAALAVRSGGPCAGGRRGRAARDVPRFVGDAGTARPVVVDDRGRRVALARARGGARERRPRTVAAAGCRGSNAARRLAPGAPRARSRAAALSAGLARRDAGRADRGPPAAGADLRRSGAAAVPAGGRLGPLRAAAGRGGGTSPRRTRADGRCAGPRAGRHGGLGCRRRAFRGADRAVDRGGALSAAVLGRRAGRDEWSALPAARIRAARRDRGAGASAAWAERPVRERAEAPAPRLRARPLRSSRARSPAREIRPRASCRRHASRARSRAAAPACPASAAPCSARRRSP